jgi:hypothetical protein
MALVLLTRGRHVCIVGDRKLGRFPSILMFMKISLMELEQTHGRTQASPWSDYGKEMKFFQNPNNERIIEQIVCILLYIFFKAWERG